MKQYTSPTPSIASSTHHQSSSTTNLYNSRRSSSLPLPANRSSCTSAALKSYKYLRRLQKFDQMDFEFALWQMVYLFIAPQKVYQNVNYRKQTKSQFARDDPAFLVLLIVSLCVTSISFAFTLRLGIGQSIYLIFYVVAVDFLLCGFIVATFFWLITNRYMIGPQSYTDIEWGYSFDVHVNAFFPPLFLLHFVQLIFYNGFIIHDWFLSRFFGNTIWLLALSYYIYITFLGYNCMPSLKNTRIILTPISIVFILYIITIIMGWNVTITFMNFYQYRVL